MWIMCVAAQVNLKRNYRAWTQFRDVLQVSITMPNNIYISNLQLKIYESFFLTKFYFLTRYFNQKVFIVSLAQWAGNGLKITMNKIKKAKKNFV